MKNEDPQKARAIRFGALLRKLRMERGWSLREVEERMEKRISNPYLSQLESGKRNVPNLELVEQLAKVFEVPVQRFVKEAIFIVGSSTKVTEQEDLWERYSRLSPKNRAVVNEMIESMERHQTSGAK